MAIYKIKKEINCHATANAFARNDGVVDCHENSLRSFFRNDSIVEFMLLLWIATLALLARNDGASGIYVFVWITKETSLRSFCYDSTLSRGF